MVDLGLSVSGNIKGNELTIMLILVILTATLFFCYCLLRMFMMVFRGDRHKSHQRAQTPPTVQAHGSYAVPHKPIRVVMAQDEELASSESEEAQTTPPAYGYWRQSVVCISTISLSSD